MPSRYVTIVLVLCAGFLGGTISNRMFSVSPVAADNKPIDKLEAKHVIVSEDITIQSSSQEPLVLKDASGHALKITNVGQFSFFISDKEGAAIPGVVLNTNGLAVTRSDQSTAQIAQFAPEGLAITHRDSSNGQISTMSTHLDHSKVTVSFDDLKIDDQINSELNLHGMTYHAHGKDAHFPQ